MEGEVYEASGYCLLKSWRKAVDLLPDIVLRTQASRTVAATNAAPQVDSLPVGRIGEAPPSAARIE